MKRFETKEEAVNYLQTLPFLSVIDIAADKLMEEEKKELKITVSEEELAAITSLFKVRGIKGNGEAERRGRKRKE